ncbi:MAG: MMPL family transporter [Acidimicrobiia bacterium]|nr:MMPL family transporter [Acidimicrobiia bacterium]
MLESLARWCYHRRRQVLVLWIVAFIAFGFVGKALDGGYSNSTKLPGSDAIAAYDLLKARFPQQAGDSVRVVFKADHGVEDPSVRPRVEALLADLARQPHVSGTTSPYSLQGGRNISPDRTIAFGEVQLNKPGFQLQKSEGTAMIDAARNASGNGVTFALSGNLIQQAEFSGSGPGEGVGILAAVVILLIAFGSVIAMGLPILMAIVGIGIGLAIVELIANFVPVPNFTPIVAAMIGIGVGIDYALFIVTRYRQGLHDGMDPESAVVLAIRTAGRAVVFAGTIVVISVLGMLLMNLPFLQGVAFGSAAAVAVTVIGSITLLPAMLGFCGTKIDSLRVPFLHSTETNYRTGGWFRWSRQVQRHPWLIGGAGLTILVALAIPAFSLKLGYPDETTQPKSRMSTQAYYMLTAGFGPGYTGQLLVAAELPNRESVSTLETLRSRLQSDPDVISVSPVNVNPAGDTALINLTPRSGSQADATKALVRRMRNDYVPAITNGTGVKAHVGGITAIFLDQDHATSSRLPVFIGVVVLLSFLLLMGVFRSVLVALKAAIMNLLSISAAYGVLVMVTQWGWGKQIFGIHHTGPITNFIPMMMFAILFGLSMDYEVFLLSRIREEYLRTGDNGLAVADGLAATARVITAAAAIMICVFLAFVLGDELAIKQIGLGLASAIFIDATLVRMVIVPSTMEILGNANWWLPKWLDPLIPHIGFESVHDADIEAELEPEPAGVGADGNGGTRRPRPLVAPGRRQR